jgi:(4-O-methyl)-D-glucuronate---lignin esterase
MLSDKIAHSCLQPAGLITTPTRTGELMNASFRTNSLLVILLGCASFVASLSHVGAQNLPPGTNIDESKVGTYTLPDPLVMADGKRVRDSKMWMEKRRPEIMSLFEENQYGYTPQKKLQPRYDVFDKNSAAFDGKAIRTQVRIRFSDDPATPTLRVLLYTPAGASGPVPTLLHIGFSPNSLVVNDPAVEEGFGWNSQTKQRVPGRQARKIGEFDTSVFLDHGFGIAMIYYGDIDPDFDGGAVHGVRTLFGDVTKERGPTEWGTIGSWSWGASRVLDFLQTNARVDGRKVALSGVSRLGKTVLWAGAQDQRFAVIMPLVSGEGGART